MTDYRIAGPGLIATVRDGPGGKITSIKDLRGTEWLAQPDPTRRGTTGARFVDAEMSGWDECAPTIDECVVNGSPLPDHGDLWSTDWQATSHGSDRLELRVRGDSLGYELRRTIAPGDHGLRIDYEARSLKATVPFLWVAHPQFLAPPGTAVTLADDITTVVDVLAEPDRVIPWTPQLATADTLASGGYRKVYVDPALRPRQASLVRSGGDGLTMSWTGCDYLGIWFDRSAFARETVVALEPSIGYRDSLAWATERGTAAQLTLERPLRWSLELSVFAISAAT